MNRRKFLATAVAAPFASQLGFFSRMHAASDDVPTVPPAQTREWRRFEITTRIALPDDAGAAQLWLPLAQTAGDYQAVHDFRWRGSGLTERVHDSCYGASVLRTTWTDQPGEPKHLEATQIVDTRNRDSNPFLPLTEAERNLWTTPTAHAPVDGIVLQTATQIIAGKSDRRDQLRAIYDWVIDHTHRDPDTPGCGTGDFRQSLASGKLGGKCVDINGLMMGLARAAGFPAREVYGIRVAPSDIYPCLGRSGDISKAQHCRVEAFLEEEGWFPLDPADARKAVLEQKIALDSPEGRALRERMFGHWEMNWIGYNSATDIALPGFGKEPPEFCFLMYPCAVTEKGQVPYLDPARFHYEITSRELKI